MAGFRAYCELAGLPREIGSLAELSPSESRHLCGSLRAKNGDVADLFDLSGNVARCEIVRADQKRAVLKIVGSVAAKPKASEVFIAQCLPKGKTFDDIIRQAVEVGAAGVFPLLSERVQVKIDPAEAGRKAEKWRLHVVEAVKQSANFAKFDLPPARKLADFLRESSSGFDLKIVASLREGSAPVGKILSQNSGYKKACILIGPEGDLSCAEYDLAESFGFVPASLGDNVMKCDTAALFALSAAISAASI